MNLLNSLVIFSSFLVFSHVCATQKKDTSSSLAISADVTNNMENENIKNERLENSPLKSGSKIFIPSAEWKVVEEDDVIFNGLHYRINLETGLKEAKLMDGSDGSKYLAAARRWLKARKKKQIGTISPEAKEEELLMQELVGNFPSIREDAEALDHDAFLADVKEIDDSHSSVKPEDGEGNASDELNDRSATRKFRSYEELKQELADLNLLMESEQNVVAKKILIHLDLTAVDEELESLTDLEYLLHNSDNALAFIDNGGLQHVVLPSLASSSWQVRLLGCQLVSAAVQNFAKAQIAALEAGLLPRLLNLLTNDTETSVRKAALSGLSSLVRHFPLAQQQFVALGQEALRATLVGLPEEAPAALRWKMVKLLSDLLTERLGDEDQISPERQEQLTAAHLEESLTDLGWCQLLVQEFTKLEENFAAGGPLERRAALEALLQAAEVSVELCGDDLRSSLPLLRLLQDKLRAGHPSHQRHERDGSDDSADEDYDTELADRILRFVEVQESNRDEL